MIWIHPEQERKTLSDYMEVHSSTGLIQSPYTNREYLKEYREQFEEYMYTLDIDAELKFGNLLLIDDDLSKVSEVVRATCIKNDYKWNKLWETLGLKYDPIANVDGVETVTTDYGEHVTDTEIGERSETTNIGERSETTNIGKRSSNSSEDGYTYPYEIPTKEAHKAHNVFESTSEKATDSVSRSATEDSLHKSSASDKLISRMHRDVVETVRKGNIGVTSTQNLIKQERNISLFYFWDVVYQDVIEAITIPIYKED